MIEVSGVLAVVVNGLIGSRVLVTHHSSLRRILGYATWDIFIILLNCFVFILIGLQLKTIASEFNLHQMVLYTGYALLIAVVMVFVRMAWMYIKSGISYYKSLQCSYPSARCSQILREAAVVGWAGMRGIVSLSAAIALPLTLPNGMPLEGRNEVIFITFIVILITLLVPGLSLPILLRWLKMEHYSRHEDAKKIRKQLTQVAKEKLHHLLATHTISEKEFNFLTAYFLAQNRVLEMSHAEEYKLKNIELARLEVIRTQRQNLLELWQIKEIDDKLLNHLETELDMVEIHIARADLHHGS